MNKENAASELPLLVTITEAAQLLAVCPRTIRRMIASGRLPCIRPVPDAIRLSRARVLALSETVSPEHDAPVGDADSPPA